MQLFCVTYIIGEGRWIVRINMSIRKMMIELLSIHELNAIELSQELSIREREVYDHLAHVKKTLTAQGMRLIISPYRCVGCGYEFRKRSRLDRPGRCPVCKEGHITMATYRVED